ncbi:hypothetical protein VTP01DRAFT_4985 [Rhizomucor pusillus]|uniref:uncharacterized protein n=1 Tax=Rhizomucor pusillus TaxID=4840 RepID=UPI0037442191
MTKKINPEEYYYNPFESSSITCHDKPLNGSKRCHQTWTSDLEQRMMVEKGSSNKNIIVAGSDDYDDEYDKDENESSWKSILFSTEIVPPIRRSVLWPVVFTYSVAVLLFALMSGELMMNHELSGEFFEFEPLNEMLGPSLQTLIQSGARFPPCMIQTTLSPDDLYVCFRLPYDEPKDGQAGSKDDDNRPETFDQDLVNEAFALANSADAVQSTCTLEQVCGMGGFANSTVPDQTFRFLTPLFVHAGLIQFLIHLAFLAVLARELEKIMNGVRLAIVFFASGMFGNLFGASFASLTAIFVGCSTSILGIAACLLVNLVFTWHRIAQPVRYLVKTTIVIGTWHFKIRVTEYIYYDSPFANIAICFLLGLLPGVDNYSNVGGFIGGLLIGIVLMPAAESASCSKKSYIVGLWILRIAAFAVFSTISIVMCNNFFKNE